MQSGDAVRLTALDHPIHVAQFDLDISAVAMMHRVIEGALDDWSPGGNPEDFLMLTDLKLALFAALLDHQLDSAS
jgi:hypothetical protein